MKSITQFLGQSNPNFLDIYLVVSAIFLPLSLFRLLDIANTAHLFILIDLGFSLFVFASLIAHGTNFVRLSFSSLLLILICCLSALVGLFNGYPLQKIVIDASRPLVFFGLYSCMRYAPAQLIAKQQISPWAANVFFVLALSALALGLSMLAMGWKFYLSLTEVSYLVPIAAFWLSGAYVRSLALGSALLLGGRRGALLGLLVALMPVISRPSLHSMLIRRIIPCVLLAAALLLAPGVRSVVMRSGTVAKIVDAFGTNSKPEEKGRTLEALTRSLDDRIREVNSVMRDLNRSWSRAILGMGSGYTYFVESNYFKIEMPWIRGVHFSPIGVYAYYGLLGLLFTYIFFARIVWAACYAIRNSTDHVTMLCAFFVVGFFADSFTAFGIFLSPLFAISCGILMNKLENGTVPSGYKSLAFENDMENSGAQHA